MTDEIISIGYTMYAGSGKNKRPFFMEKAKEGNFEQAMNTAHERAKNMRMRMHNNKKLFSLCVWMGAYGFSFRVLLALLQ